METRIRVFKAGAALSVFDLGADLIVASTK